MWECAGCRRGSEMLQIRLQHLSLRPQHYTQGEQQKVSQTERGGRCSRRFGSVGERGFHCRNLPEVRAPEGVFHADTDQICGRTHDYVLQVLQPAVWPPLERLRLNRCFQWTAAS